MSLDDAMQIKYNFPVETRGFTIFEIREIWEEHSESLAASWIIPHKEDVEYIFDRFRNFDGTRKS